MSRFLFILASGAVALLMVGTAHAQTSTRNRAYRDQPGVHQMEIFSGPARIVRSFGINLSPGESTSLKEIDRLENESAYARDLLTLKRQYVVSERLLEPHRRAVQLDLYGRTLTTSNYGSYSNGGGYGYGNGYGGGFGYPYNVGGYGLNNGGGYATAYGGSSGSETFSLAIGTGYQGELNNSMAAVIAQQATPTYAASLDRDYERVVLRASGSRALQVALHLPTPDAIRKERDRTIQADAEMTAPAGITLTLKNGDRVYGTKMREDKEWITIDLLKGGATRIRPSEVIRIDLARTGGIVPAADGK